MPPLSAAQVQLSTVKDYWALKNEDNCSKESHLKNLEKDLNKTGSNKDILSFADSITPKANKNDLQSLLSGT